MARVENFHEPGIHPLRESMVALDSRSQRLHRRTFNGVDFEYRVRISHGHRTDTDDLAGDRESIWVNLSRRVEWQRARIEVRHAHVDRHHLPAEDARMDEPGGTIHRDSASPGATTAMEQGGDATGAVTALFDLIAIGVEYAIENRCIGAAWRLEDERLIVTDPCMAIRQSPKLIGAQHGLPGGRIEHDKVVTDTMHLGEIDAHGQKNNRNPLSKVS